MLQWFKDWRTGRNLRQEKEAKEFKKTVHDALELINPKLQVPKELKQMGVEGIRMCYPDRHGDIGPGDDNPNNW